MSRERVKVFVGNEIEHGIEILKIGSRTNQVSCYKGNGTRRLRFNDLFVECTGVIMAFQIPLLIIDRRGVSIMSGVLPTRSVAHLRVYDA